jgi:hypothetical protein
MGMEKYMGYQAKEPVQRPERLLPERIICGIPFTVDIDKLEFREAGNPTNRMPIIGAKEEMGFSHFFFDTQTKNHYAGATKMPNEIPDHVIMVFLPPLKELEPIGLARKHGIAEDAYQNRRAVKPELIIIEKIKSGEQMNRKPRGQRF